MQFAGRVDDLAGTVAAAAVTGLTTVDWTYIGDSGVGLITSDGAIRRISPDDIEPLRPLFPPSGMCAYTRMWTIRDLYRNKVGAPGFGALTGEADALPYIRSGQWPRIPGDRVIVFSDGARPLIVREDIRQMITREGDIEAAMKHAATSLGLTDEVSVAILRVT